MCGEEQNLRCYLSVEIFMRRFKVRAKVRCYLSEEQWCIGGGLELLKMKVSKTSYLALELSNGDKVVGVVSGGG